jgi:predicted ATP-dependent Lon-type protease
MRAVKARNMSNTPLTDAAIRSILQTGPHYRVNADFARSLELEINAWRYAAAHLLKNYQKDDRVFEDEIAPIRNLLLKAKKTRHET